jgi:hypothetical protein
VLIAALSIGVSLLLRPQLPQTPQQGNTNIASSSNALSSRQNVARPLQRIEDLLGRARVWLTLIGLPYTVFETRKEVEYAIMCAGVGFYDIDDVRDGTTQVAEVSGMSVEFYDPYTSPLSGADPVLRIGDPITEPLITVSKSTSVNGQTLFAPNEKRLHTGDGVDGHPVEWWSDGSLRIMDSGFSWDNYFEVGESIATVGAQYTDGVTTVDLDGTYIVESFPDAYTLVLQDPELVNPDWNELVHFSGGHTPALPGVLVADVDNVALWTGPFEMDVDDADQYWVNVVATSNLYGIQSTDGKQVALSVDLMLQIQQLDENGDPVGPWRSFPFTIDGSSVSRSLVGFTEKVAPGFVGRARAQMRRVSGHDYGFDGQVVDEVKWRDLYAISAVTVTDFGNVTTAHTRTPATPAALGLKERKLNALLTRKIPARDGDGFTSELFPTVDAALIFCFAALDPFNGRRALAELDLDNIFDTIAAVKAYFGDDIAAEFGFVFDDDQTSFEEMANAIAAAAFCIPLRRGSLIQLQFEQPNPDSSILFNHRNIIPKSESRSSHFGLPNENNGVELHYIDGGNYDAPAVYRIPVDGSANNPIKLTTQGIRNIKQAGWLAWRQYNKLLYHHVSTQFDATSEASTIGLLDRVLVANTIKKSTQDGEVLSQDGFVLGISQDFTAVVGKDYVIFVQLPNGTTDSIPITAGADSRHVVLDRVPATALSLDDANWTRALYWIVATDDGREQAFLISQKEQGDRDTYKVSAINYDVRYYQNDSRDPSGGLIDTGGGEIVDDSGNVITTP